MANNNGDEGDRTSRRRFIALVGASGTAALAGCSNGGGGGGTSTSEATSSGGSDTTTSEETEGTSSGGSSDTATSEETEGTSSDEEGTSTSSPVEVVDTTMTGVTNTAVPTNANLNPLATQNYDYIPGRLLYARMAAYNYKNQEFQTVALDDWNFDGSTVTLTLRDDLTWQNGDDLTAEAVLTQLRLMKKTGTAIWDFLENVEQGENDKTVVLNLNSEVNPTILKTQLAGEPVTRIFGHPDVFGEFVDQSAEAVQTFQPADEIISSGPFQFDSRGQQAWSLARNEEYYRANNVNFTGYDLLYRESNTAIQQGLANGELDSMTSLFVPPQTKSSFPNSMKEFNVPAKWGYGILFNHADPVFGQRNVRQAVAHVINRQAIVDNAGPETKFPANVVTGIAPRDQENYLGDQMSKFKTYGVDTSNTDQATQLMNDAGFSKSGGKWRDEGGSTVGGSYYSPAGWTDWTASTNTVVDQLNSFGFDLSANTVPVSDWNNNYINSNFKMGAFYWMQSGVLSTFPYYILRWQMLNPDINGGHNYIPSGSNATTGTASNGTTSGGSPGITNTLPALSGSGQMQINPLEEIQSVGSMTDQQQIRETIQRVAWNHNIDLPMLGLVSKVEQSWITNNGWELASNDSVAGNVKWATQYLPRVGKMQAQQ